MKIKIGNWTAYVLGIFSNAIMMASISTYGFAVTMTYLSAAGLTVMFFGSIMLIIKPKKCAII